PPGGSTMHRIHCLSFALCAVFAGCSSSSDTTPTTTDTGTVAADTSTPVDTGTAATDSETPMDTGTAPADTSSGGTKHTVTVGAGGTFAFAPKDLTIKVGDTVEWTWSGAIPHSVTSGTSCTSDGKFDSGLVPSPKTFTQKFDTAGTVSYFCSAHCLSNGMTGTITVTP
ncbi:MAG: cupredoxin domain-containing protein, partial [Polyangiales bacterium]